MDFTLSERETYFRDRVRDFIAREIAPRDARISRPGAMRANAGR